MIQPSEATIAVNFIAQTLRERYDMHTRNIRDLKMFPDGRKAWVLRRDEIDTIVDLLGIREEFEETKS